LFKEIGFTQQYASSILKSASIAKKQKIEWL